MARGQKYSAKTKAEVLGALSVGGSVGEVAKTFGVPLGTVKRWRAENKGQLSETVEPEKRKKIGELLLEQVEKQSMAITKIAELVNDPEWLKAQDAGGLGMFVGITADKMVRVLEAMHGPKNASSEPGPERTEP